MAEEKAAWDVDLKKLGLKKLGLWFGGFVLLLILGFLSYLQWAYVTYIDRTVPKYTGISSYRITAKVHNDYEWYANLDIRETDGAQLLSRHPFRPGFERSVLNGKVFDAPLGGCSDCSYYLDDKNRGPYDYVLYVMSKDRRHLFLVEMFGD